jgi:organic hydroperoxide reductase OsmC/OhrA
VAKISFREARVEQTTRFFRKGAIRPGTIDSGCARLETRIEIDSDEPPERIRQLVQLAQASCFTHGAMRSPVPMQTTVQLNGNELTMDEAP